MPAAAPVEEHLAARPQPRHEVLEIGHRRSRAADDGRIERPAPCREHAEGDEAAADLEAFALDVLVRHVVARDVHRWPEQQRERPRADERTRGSSGGHVQRNDHALIMAYAAVP